MGSDADAPRPGQGHFNIGAGMPAREVKMEILYTWRC
jgi:hypothetical protein